MKRYMSKYSGSSLEATELKLKTTPTGGVSGEHSPYYRRLLSAGYKGFLQGTIGGAGFYGSLGLIIGGLIAVPAMAIPGVGLAALTLIPAAGAVGLFKGASTFGNIGSVAAISAESADLSEQRRYLLDRYYDLPDGPEGDKQAEIIKQELAGLQKTDRKHPLFHWKTVAVCAAIGGALALALFSPLGVTLLAETPVMHIMESVIHATHLSALGSATALTVAGTGVGVGLGALMGAAVGLDRHYVRKWFDGSEKLLHDKGHSTHAIDARAEQMDRLREAAKIDNQTKLILERRKGLSNYDVPDQQSASSDTPTVKTVASLDVALPDTKITSAHLQDRLADIQKAMDIPVL